VAAPCWWETLGILSTLVRRRHLLRGKVRTVGCRIDSEPGQDERRSLADYEEAVRREIYEEFRVAVRMASIVYSYPRLCHRLLPAIKNIVMLYYDGNSVGVRPTKRFMPAKYVIKILLKRTAP